MAETIQLSSEIQAALEQIGQPSEAVAAQERFVAFVQAIVAKRDQAVAFRQNQGTEDIWRACEEAYLGIDDANRSQFPKSRWAKPSSKEGPAYTDSSLSRSEEMRSTVFIKLTARYVDAGKAKLSEILLPIDDKPFSLKPTPIPWHLEHDHDDSPVLIDGHPAQRDPNPAEFAREQQQQFGLNAGLPTAAAPSEAQGRPLLTKDLIQEDMERYEDQAKKAEKRIEDWLVECNHTAEMRKVIFDGARIGVGVLKGPYPRTVKSMAVSREAEGFGVTMVEEIKPATKWIDPWNFFPDPACGENIHDGEYVLERDYISPKQLRELRGQPGYHTDAIDRVLKEGPAGSQRSGNDNPAASSQQHEHQFERWHYYGTISRDDLEMVNQDLSETLPEDVQEVYAIITLVNDVVIYGVLNQLKESGAFPYYVVPWQRRCGSWAGIGVAEQVAMPQRLINAATRAMANNAGKSSGSQVVVDRGAITPANDDWQITPDKVWQLAPGATVDDVRKAFTIFNIPNLTEPLLKIAEYALRLAEESSSIPLITQGQSGKTQPDTFGGMQLQNNNANQLLRDIGYTVDDNLTEPLIRNMYEYLLLDPTVPNNEKGDFQIHAHGSSALVERAIQEETLISMIQLSANPLYGADPQKTFAQFAKSRRLDPRDFQYSEEELMQMQQQPPTPPPQVQAAQIRAQLEQLKLQLQAQQHQDDQALKRELAQVDLQLRSNLSALDTDRDAAYLQAENDRTELMAETKLAELQLKRELAMLDYANKRDISLDELKTSLAETTMRLRTQKELAGVKGGQVARDEVEPPGRAPNGEAFQR